MQIQISVSDRERYVQDQFEKWSESFIIPYQDEYELKKYFELQWQYENTNSEHVKTKRELIDMMYRLKSQLQPLKQKKNNYLYEKLLKASVNRELVSVRYGDRKVGKTSTLIEFAKEFRLSVIVPHQAIADRLKEIYGYDAIYGYGQNGESLRGLFSKKVVLDEGFVQENKLGTAYISSYKYYNVTLKLNEMGFEIITGYRTNV